MALFALKTLILSTLLTGWGVSAQSTECAIPSWTIDDVKLSFRNPTQANFTLTNVVTKTAEAISCRLEFATLCEIRGTPQNKDLYIHLQTRNEEVWFNVTTPYTCDGK
jgi:hypothetical protein